MSEISMTIEELRTAANALISAADSLQRFFSSEDDNEEELLQEPRPLTLEDVRDILRVKCEMGFAADIKQLIANLGARSLKEVNPNDYEPLVNAVLALGTGGDGDA
jgi:hypothetical protein